MVRNEKEGLRLLVSPTLREVVLEEDLAYIDSLLEDFLERAKRHPAALFQQLCSLAVGPLVTQETGTRLTDYPLFMELSSRFLPI